MLFEQWLTILKKKADKKRSNNLTAILFCVKNEVSFSCCFMMEQKCKNKVDQWTVVWIDR